MSWWIQCYKQLWKKPATQPKSKGHPGTAWFKNNSKLPREKRAPKSTRKPGSYRIVSRKATLQMNYEEHAIKEETSDEQHGPCPKRTHWKQRSKIPYPWTRGEGGINRNIRYQLPRGEWKVKTLHVTHHGAISRKPHLNIITYTWVINTHCTWHIPCYNTIAHAKWLANHFFFLSHGKPWDTVYPRYSGISGILLK